MRNLTVHIVDHPRKLDQFIDFQYKLYEGNPHWVPPIKSQYKKLFQRDKNPFFRSGDMCLFLVLEGDKIVGRIAAIDNEDHRKLHRDNTGFFGFFECINDVEVAGMLMNAAVNWLKGKGRNAVRGPVSPSMNYESGFLADGFDDSPRLMMPYTQEYYKSLMEKLGLTMVKQLWAYKINNRAVIETPKVVRLIDMIKTRNDVKIRTINMRKFREEIHTIVHIYNTCWANNWGFVPISREAAELMATEMKPIVEKSLILFAEADGKPVGMIVALYDYNDVLKKMQGKLWPFGFLHLINAKNKIEWLRMMLIGVLPEYREKGIDALLYVEAAQNALKLNKLYCEGSWTLEDNDRINRLAKMLGGEVYKRYNMYENAI